MNKCEKCKLVLDMHCVKHGLFCEWCEGEYCPKCPRQTPETLSIKVHDDLKTSEHIKGDSS